MDKFNDRNNHLNTNQIKKISIRNKNKKKEKMIMKISANSKDLIKTCSKVSNNKIMRMKKQKKSLMRMNSKLKTHFHGLSNLKPKKFKGKKAKLQIIKKMEKVNRLKRKINKNLSKICKKILRIYKILSKLFQTSTNLKSNNRMYNQTNNVVIILKNKKNSLNLGISKIFNNIKKL